ncbi:peptide/nickel transport system permease protein [Planifilum fulgidum]|uniref:Peptide/nickel transport system permease protein n=1 Tax=Planifilum fulgidum TaxID=201973 RepID=A0A1I2Q2J0_9BACL|nr:ABC transporter permease [Planifilum fulgidum]SFG22582.1 peptide/nickel transport system permease protein [Planifilum fulgidum]
MKRPAAGKKGGRLLLLRSGNRRQQTLLLSILVGLLLLSVWLWGILLDDEKTATRLQEHNRPPSLEHPFGTDWLGRDMFVRTIKGLSLSIMVGLSSAAAGTLVSLLLGLAAATMGKAADRIITWLIDLFLSVPHLVSLILIAFVLGGGKKGVIIGIALTHWPVLCRVLRAEILQLRSAEFVQLSRRLGKSRWWIAMRHVLPHLLPQLIVGFLLMFPHAILHEASITFLGLGLSPDEPAIGVILSESMRYLSTGHLWLAFFPGLSLLLVVRAFDLLGENVRLLIDPHHYHE